MQRTKGERFVAYPFRGMREQEVSRKARKVKRARKEEKFRVGDSTAIALGIKKVETNLRVCPDLRL